jgi:hypothetical protein
MVNLVSEHNGAVLEYADIQAAHNAIQEQAEKLGAPFRIEATSRSTKFGFEWGGFTLWWRVESVQPSGVSTTTRGAGG